MESLPEQDLPLHPKSYPLAAETTVGNATHGSVLVAGSLASFYAMAGACNDHNMQIAASRLDWVFYNNVFVGFRTLSEIESLINSCFWTNPAKMWVLYLLYMPEIYVLLLHDFFFFFFFFSLHILPMGVGMCSQKGIWGFQTHTALFMTCQIQLTCLCMCSHFKDFKDHWSLAYTRAVLC